MTSHLDLRAWFGGIDIYLFDQLLKGRFTPDMHLLDAGCGDGRNLVYFIRTGYEVFGVDSSPAAIAQVRQLATALSPQYPVENFRLEAVEKMSFKNESFDAVISSAVLHFASDEEHFQSMLVEMWRVLRYGGIFFSRLASTIGIENRVKHLQGRRYHLPDGSERFLVDEEMILKMTETLGGALIEPIKTVNVQNLRSMTNWCLRKT
ncbi:MAG TPA: class I SAM-dependent methyltransferase [Pyrinomonadaceae bacterium]|jgi:SAM-dependent methyltransferase